MVGAAGTVVGLDRSSDMLVEARQRTAAAGNTRVTFVEGDAATWRDAEPFDAVVGRLVLFHVPDPVAVVRHHLANLRPGGLFVAIDFDIGSSRSEPPLPLVHQCLDWVVRAFSAAGAAPMIGARLGVILDEAGLEDVRTFGVQPYLRPRTGRAPRCWPACVRSLAGAITAHGIATEEQLGLDTLEQRIFDEGTRANAVILLPAVAGAWGRRQGTA